MAAKLQNVARLPQYRHVVGSVSDILRTNSDIQEVPTYSGTDRQRDTAANSTSFENDQAASSQVTLGIARRGLRRVSRYRGRIR
jgi:hypothetical protein